MLDVSDFNVKYIRFIIDRRQSNTVLVRAKHYKPSLTFPGKEGVCPVRVSSGNLLLARKVSPLRDTLAYFSNATVTDKPIKKFFFNRN